MKRREFLAISSIVTLGPYMAWASQDILEYEAGLIEEKLAAGKVVMVDFYENYCSTCRAQARVLENLRNEDPAYDENIVFINVDIIENSDLAKTYNVTRHGTLLMLLGDKVLARVDSDTSVDAIKEFLDAGLV